MADYHFFGEEPGDDAGDSVSGAGDVDGDGLSDILIGAPGNSENANLSGKSYLILGASLGTDPLIFLSQAERVMVGETDAGQVGGSVSSAGDVNGDGRDDLLVGGGQIHGATAERSGGAYVVFSPF